MSRYIGQDVTYGLFDKQILSASTKQHDLLYSVPSAASIQVICERAILEPYKDYTITNQNGTSRLKIDDNINLTDTNGGGISLYVIFLGKKLTTPGPTDTSAFEEKVEALNTALASKVSMNDVDDKIEGLIGGAPDLLNTLKELSDALDGDPSFAATVANQIGTVAGDLAEEVTARISADTVLQDNIDAEEAARIAAVAAVQAEVDAEEVARAAADSALQDNIDAEETRALAAESALSARLTKTEENLSFPVVHVFNDNQQVYADASKGTSDPSYLLRDGWYFENRFVRTIFENGSVINNQSPKINWYFYDGTTNNVAVEDFSMYAVVTFDSTASLPFFVAYTIGTENGWYKSKKVFSIPSSSGIVAGKKYLVYAGQEPNVHTDLPRIACVDGTVTGPFAANEQILTAALNTNSAAAENTVKLLAERLGVHSSTYKQEVELRIKPVLESSLATVAKTGSYNDLTDTPTIPTQLDDLINVSVGAPQNLSVLRYHSGVGINSDGEWQADLLAEVATSGSYNDLVDVPNTENVQHKTVQLNATSYSDNPANYFLCKEEVAGLDTGNDTWTTAWELTLEDNSQYTFDITLSGKNHDASGTSNLKGIFVKIRFFAITNSPVDEVNPYGITIGSDNGGMLTESETIGNPPYVISAEAETLNTNKIVVKVKGGAGEFVRWGVNVKYTKLTVL